MDRMNKEALLELLNNLKIDKQEFWILSFSSLVLRDIYPDAGDLDIAVTDKGLAMLKQNYNLEYKTNGWFIVSNNIEGVCLHDISKYKTEKICGYNVQDIREYYEYLCSSHRVKDKARISLVKKYIKDNNI